MKEYEKQKRSDEAELAEIAEAENQKKLEKFVKIEKNISTTPQVGAFLSKCKCELSLV